MMLDVYRFILALCVVQGHLLKSGAPWLAWQAVFSFYTLSGFLMTLILNDSYGFTAGGLLRFAVNRWLRLFPIYYIVIGLTAAYIVFVGPLTQVNTALTLPSTAKAIVGNLIVVTLPSFDSSLIATQRLSPPAWSLGIELFCYVVLAAYFAGSVRRLLFLLAFGTALAVPQIISSLGEADYGFQGHYSVLQAGLIPFAAGGLAYFLRDKLEVYGTSRLSILVGVLVVNFASGYWSDFHKYVTGLYVVVALNFLLVPILFAWKEKASWQRVCGGLSYPLFLSHVAIGTLIAIYAPLAPLGFTYFLCATAVSVLFCLLLYYFVDTPIQQLRSSVKKRRSAPELGVPRQNNGSATAQAEPTPTPSP